MINNIDIKELSCAEKLQAVNDSLYVIGGKWKLPVIIALSQGHTRFNELQRKTGISGKVLSNELKELELNGFVKRQVSTEDLKSSIAYQLSPYSQSLESVIFAMIGWGIQHRVHIKEGRNFETSYTA
ncbi:helix-turn-helix domain-containing protein [Pedobacter miscanthi]|uniref:winged helix-turn-helix transcriptional regulator n=1 Tax=Pedobacter miscanthi TaxID=2259170 RepID=UPI00292EF280|nr:helix-turn-helix domain-containing protein [Pedobacter miscanthi]